MNATELSILQPETGTSDWSTPKTINLLYRISNPAFNGLPWAAHWLTNDLVFSDISSTSSSVNLRSDWYIQIRASPGKSVNSVYISFYILCISFYFYIVIHFLIFFFILFFTS